MYACVNPSSAGQNFWLSAAVLLVNLYSTISKYMLCMLCTVAVCPDCCRVDFSDRVVGRRSDGNSIYNGGIRASPQHRKIAEKGVRDNEIMCFHIRQFMVRYVVVVIECASEPYIERKQSARPESPKTVSRIDSSLWPSRGPE